MDWIKNTDATEWDKLKIFFYKNYGKWIVYALVNKINGKMYIGKSYDFRARMNRHKNYKNSPKNNETALYRAIDKYGIGNFDLKIIEDFENFTDKQLVDRENFWIRCYNTIHKDFGYNLIVDDENKPSRILTPELSEKFSQHSKSLSRDWLKKKVRQIDIDTHEEIKIWDSIEEAGRNFANVSNVKKPSQPIWRACKQVHETSLKRRDAYGYYWEFLDNPINYDECLEKAAQKRQEKNLRAVGRKLPSRAVKQMDLRTHELIKVWRNAVEAAIGIGKNKNGYSAIQLVCHKKKRFGRPNGNIATNAHGFYWEWVD